MTPEVQLRHIFDSKWHNLCNDFGLNSHCSSTMFTCVDDQRDLAGITGAAWRHFIEKEGTFILYY